MSRISIALVCILCPVSVAAQGFAPLSSGLKVGQKVYVVMDAPCTTAECGGEFVAGRIWELTASSIVVNDGRNRYALPAVEVRRVERSGDRIWNGMLAGFAVGFGVGFVSVMAEGCDSNRGCLFGGPGWASLAGLFTGGIGAGVGTLTDALISGRRVVFDRPGESRKTVISPIVGARSGGIRVSVRF
jgi:hypothetical protein